MTRFTLIERTSVAGINIVLRDLEGLERIFKDLGGELDWHSDKDVQISFPSAAAAATYQREAKARGALFDTRGE